LAEELDDASGDLIAATLMLGVKGSQVQILSARPQKPLSEAVSEESEAASSAA